MRLLPTVDLDCVMLQVPLVQEHLVTERTGPRTLLHMVQVAVLAHGRTTRVDKAAYPAAELALGQVLEVGVDAGRRGVMATDVQLQHQNIAEAPVALLASKNKGIVKRTNKASNMVKEKETS